MRHVVSCKILLRDQAGNVLLLRRSKTHPRSPLAPDLPGGAIEDGEQINQGLAREILEETGLMVDPSQLRLLHAASGLKGDDLSLLRLLMTGNVADVEPPVTISWEHDRYEWLSFDDARHRFDGKPAYGDALTYIKQHGLLDDAQAD